MDTCSPNLVNWGLVIPCGDIRQSFTNALVFYYGMFKFSKKVDFIHIVVFTNIHKATFS